MWARRSSKFRKFPTRRRTFLRKGKPAEVSNYAAGFDLTAYSGTEGATMEYPAIWVTPIMSLSSVLTDYVMSGGVDGVRSIPPQYRGISVRKGLLDVDVCVTACPLGLETQDLVGVTYAWSRLCLLVYKDEFVWQGGVETPNLDVLHPWQNDLISGAAHTEFNRPTRILQRRHFVLPACGERFDQGAGGPSGSWSCKGDRSAFRTKLKVPIKPVYLNERETLWMALLATNPWTTADRPIIFGTVAAGPIVYKLRTA